MPELQDSRRKLKIAIAVMVAADVVAAVVLFSPLVGSAASRRIEMSRLSAELQKKTRDLAAELGKVASESGVRILQAKYELEEPTPAGIIPVAIEGNFSGDYLQLVRFINALERSKQFFTVDSINLAGESSGPVKLEIKAHSYLRSGV